MISFRFKTYLNLLIEQIYDNNNDELIEILYEIIVQSVTKARFQKYLIIINITDSHLRFNLIIVNIISIVRHKI